MVGGRQIAAPRLGGGYIDFEAKCINMVITIEC